MSRVQVENLVGDFEDEFIIGGSGAYISEKLGDKRLTEISDIEIVPRKIVEEIIKDCEKKMKFYGTLRVVCSEDKGAYNTAKSIKEYAESLLKQFEEGTE